MQFVIYLFILELFFGLNGKWLVLGGVPIRHWLFAVVILLVYGKTFLFVLSKWKEKKSEGTTFLSFVKEELASFKGFDWFLLIFVLLHSIWILIIPYTQMDTNPGVLGKAMSSGLCLILMAIYFPAVYLLRNGQVQWKKYRNCVIGCCVVLSALHIILYVLERIQWEQDHTYYFMERVFDFWERLVGGHFERQLILMPAYSVRIIYSCSIFVLMSFYFIVGQTKKRYFFWTLLNIVALLTTGTRSLILGTLIGVCAFGFFDFWIHGWSKKTKKKIAVIAGGILVFILVVDAAAFQGMNVTRMLSSFKVSQEALEKGEAQTLTWENSEYSADKEIRGTANSNATRILQIKSLLEKIKEKPLFGHGFTLDVCDMQGLNYIAKVGLSGVLLWVVFLVLLFKRTVRMEKRERGTAFPAIYLVVAVLFDVHLQVIFGSLTMAAAVFLFLDLEYKELQIQEKNDEKAV